MTTEALPVPAGKEVVSIRVCGRIDNVTAPQIDEILESLHRTGQHEVVFDLQDVDYISSRGWGVFLGHLREFRDAGGDLKLARMSEDVYEVFKLMDFFWFLRSYDSVEAAVADFEKGVAPMP